MNRGLGGTAGLAAAAAVALAIAHTAPPTAQVDVFTHGPAPRLDRPELAAVVDAFATPTGADPAVALAGATPPATAGAHGGQEGLVLGTVEVRRIATDRIRIRVAARDGETARATAEGLRAGLVEAGVRERLRIASETTGGRARMAAALLAALALGWAVVHALTALARRLGASRWPSGRADPLRGAASTR